MTPDQQKIRDRIRQLRNRTTARGCTEQEAMAAAAKAAELMAAHGYHHGDIEFEEAGSATKAGSRTVRVRLWAAIAHCTCTSAILGHRAAGPRIDFIGRAPGPEIAVYLREVCDRAIDREVATFKTGTFYRRRRSIATKRAAVADFTDGMITRMIARLRTLFPETDASAAERKLAQAERDRRHPSLETVSTPNRERRYDEAAAAGYGAGGRVTLSHGVGTTGAPLQIGRS